MEIASAASNEAIRYYVLNRKEKKCLASFLGEIVAGILYIFLAFFMSICIFDLRYDEIETNCSSTLLCSKFPTQKGMKTATRFLDFKRRGRL